MLEKILLRNVSSYSPNAAVWKPKREFDGTALAYCFSLLNTKERLLQAVRNVPLVASTDTSQGLMAEAAALKETSDQELPGISPLAFQVQCLEGDPILQEVITADSTTLGHPAHAHLDTRSTRTWTPDPRPLGQAVGAQRRRVALLV